MADRCPYCQQPLSEPIPTPASWTISTAMGREARISARLVEIAQALHDANNQADAAGMLGISRATLQRERLRLLATLDVATLPQAIALLVSARLVGLHARP
jgi:Bacterial regulatory protein, Fis family